MISRTCTLALAAGTALLLAGCGEPDSAAPKGDDTPLPPEAASSADMGLPNPDVAQPVPDWPPASRPPTTEPPAETGDDSPPDAGSDVVPPTDDAPPEVVPDSVLIEPEPPADEPM
jgi:hypothetical protein